jgi:hypothetical protein
MKLYATTTSERATKGQGGQTLDIIIYNEEKKPSIAIRVITLLGGKVYASINTDMRYGLIKSHEVGFLEEETKGNKQKGENCYNCGNSLKDHPSICQSSFK